jgi:hypothetical protein
MSLTDMIKKAGEHLSNAWKYIEKTRGINGGSLRAELFSLGERVNPKWMSFNSAFRRRKTYKDKVPHRPRLDLQYGRGNNSEPAYTYCGMVPVGPAKKRKKGVAGWFADLARRWHHDETDVLHRLWHGKEPIDLRDFKDLERNESKALRRLNRRYMDFQVRDKWDYWEEVQGKEKELEYKIPPRLRVWRIPEQKLSHGWPITVLESGSDIDETVFRVLEDKYPIRERTLMGRLDSYTFYSDKQGVATIKDGHVDSILLNGKEVYLPGVPKEIYECKKLRALSMHFARGANLSKLRYLPDLEILAVKTACSHDAQYGYSRRLGRRNVSKKFKNCRLHGTKALGHLRNLRVLYLEGRFSGIKPLKGLTKLEQLTVAASNHIKDLSPLKNLKNLRELSLNRVTDKDSSCLEELVSLERVSLSGSGIVDPFTYLIKLKKQYDRLEGVSIGESSIDYSKPATWDKIDELRNLGVVVHIPQSMPEFEKKHNYKASLMTRLFDEGFDEEHAEVLLDTLEGIVGGKTNGQSKNKVYTVNRAKQKKVVAKFIEDEDEAKKEALVNHAFSQHKVLKHFVAENLTEDPEKPIEIKINEKKKIYLLLQEDVRDKADKWFEYVLNNGTAQELRDYLNHWMMVLANVHVYGTYIMNKLGNHDKSQSLTREKDEERVKTLYDILDKPFPTGLWKDMTQYDIENGNEFIHKDLKFLNRIGQYIIDWGNSGRGNGLQDVAAVLSDGKIQKRARLKEDDCKGLLHTYLTEKRRLVGIKNKLTPEEINSAYGEFRSNQWLYSNGMAGYYVSKGGILVPGEDLTRDSMIANLPEIEEEVRIPENGYEPTSIDWQLHAVAD